MCGGGMPLNQHVSVFVVWQAVKKSGGPPPPLPDGFRIYMPGVIREVGPQTGAQTGTQGLAPGAPTPAAAPLPPLSNVPADALAQIVRAAAWNRLGLEYNPASSLAAYARQVGLGAPLSNLFEVAGYLAQAYHGGIALAPLDAPGNVGHIAW
jgi:hypothetical protein